MTKLRQKITLGGNLGLVRMSHAYHSQVCTKRSDTCAHPHWDCAASWGTGEESSCGSERWGVSLRNCQATHMDTDVLLRVNFQWVQSISTLNNIFPRVCMDVYWHLVFIPMRQWKQSVVSWSVNSFTIKSAHTRMHTCTHKQFFFLKEHLYTWHWGWQQCWLSKYNLQYVK